MTENLIPVMTLSKTSKDHKLSTSSFCLRKIGTLIKSAYVTKGFVTNEPRIKPKMINPIIVRYNTLKKFFFENIFCSKENIFENDLTKAVY